MGLYLGSTKIPTISFYKQGGIVPSGIFTVPSNATSTYDVTSYAFAQVPSGEDNLWKRIQGVGLSTYSNSTATQIASFAFAYMYDFTSVSMPAVTSIGQFAFTCCSNITSVSFPLCVSIGSSAFQSCTKLVSVNISNCTSLQGNGIFSGCSLLPTINLPSVASSIPAYTFMYCYSLSSANVPLATSIGTYGFGMCSYLSSMSLSRCSAVGQYAFQGCSRLSTINLPICSIIYAQAFSGCYNLLSMYLTNSSLCSLSNSNAFTSTPIAGYTTSTGGVYGSIYVPSSLLASYKAATNWVNYSNRMVGV